MASACVNNSIGMSTESFPSSAATFGWLSPRISFSRDEEPAGKSAKSSPARGDTKLETAADFEFLLGDDLVDMLPADELFSEGKLVPLCDTSKSQSEKPLIKMKFNLETMPADSAPPDACVFSPRAPTCTSRWKELLGLRKLQLNSSKALQSTASPNPKSIRTLLNRSSRSSASCSTSTSLDNSLNLPLLMDLENEPVPMSSCRLSLSSTSSHDPYEDHPRLSLDTDKPIPNPFLRNPNPTRIRVARKSAVSSIVAEEGGIKGGAMAITIDSPRMNASGKIVFKTLERSSSSPSTFNGGNRVKHRGMERSYSANVRVTPVLNVPVCSLRGSSKPGSIFGFGPLFSSQPKKDMTAKPKRGRTP